MNPADQLKILKRGAVEVISEEELLEKLKRGKPLKVKAGFDPTAPDLHLGHTVLLQKLKQFQDLGHEIQFVIGDYTARIGDPTGRSETRPRLSEEEIRKNVKTYEEQVFKILDPKKTKTCFNSTWLAKMSAADFIDLTSKHTVARMLERNDFEKRFKGGEDISVVEFLYPLLQAYDSVQLHSDIELGGTDQKFNLLMGRTIQKRYGQESQVVMTLPLLVGTDGIQKMSKSYGNFIGIAEPANTMFGKVMSISDELMWSYYELLSDKKIDEIETLKKSVTSGTLHPKQAKIDLGKEITARFHGAKAAGEAADEFENVYAKKKLPSVIPESRFPKSGPLVEILEKCGGFKSKSEIRRLIEQGGVKVNDQKVSDINHQLKGPGEYLVQAGKHWHNKIILG
ncbi:MAG: tyrosine--tRNA ligase [Deltaproteobacteria bacterium]|nr:tyrosine--tRNA ligase [Deltaproteobacteria bacterium]